MKVKTWSVHDTSVTNCSRAIPATPTLLTRPFITIRGALSRTICLTSFVSNIFLRLGPSYYFRHLCQPVDSELVDWYFILCQPILRHGYHFSIRNKHYLPVCYFGYLEMFHRHVFLSEKQIVWPVLYKFICFRKYHLFHFSPFRSWLT